MVAQDAASSTRGRAPPGDLPALTHPAAARGRRAPQAAPRGPALADPGAGAPSGRGGKRRGRAPVPEGPALSRRA